MQTISVRLDQLCGLIRTRQCVHDGGVKQLIADNGGLEQLLRNIHTAISDLIAQAVNAATARSYCLTRYLVNVSGALVDSDTWLGYAGKNSWLTECNLSELRRLFTIEHPEYRFRVCNSIHGIGHFQVTFAHAEHSRCSLCYPTRALQGTKNELTCAAHSGQDSCPSPGSIPHLSRFESISTRDATTAKAMVLAVVERSDLFNQ